VLHFIEQCRIGKVVKKQLRVSAKPGNVLGSIKGEMRASSPFFKKFIC
jgi:hypothetical protein